MIRQPEVASMARASKFEDNKIAVLEAIQAAAARHAKVPTVRELAASFEVATATMHSWLTRMAEEELIAWEPGRHRSLRLSQTGIQQLSSPARP